MIKVEIDFQEMPQGKRYDNSQVKEVLKQSHYKKCSYCETANIKGEVEHFRPKNKNAYYWLVNDYENLLWSCHDCNQLKGAKLPVLEKNANEPDNVSTCNEKEILIMINPTNTNFNDLNIAYEKDGEMNSENSLVQNTINICQLNREDLLDKRIEVYKNFEKKINYMKKLTKKEDKINFLKEELIKPIREDKHTDYIAFRKFIIKNWLKDMLD